MKTPFRAAGVALLCLQVACAWAADLDGTWASDSRTKGGLGSQWEFGAKGDATYTFGALVDFRYETKPGAIKFTLVTTDGTPPPASDFQPYTLQGDSLALDPDSAQKRQVMTRVGHADASRPLVGEWTYKHPTGGPALMRYSGKGMVQLFVPLKTLAGSWKMDGDAMRLELPGGQPPLVAKRVSEDVLSIRDNKGTEATYRRFRY